MEDTIRRISIYIVPFLFSLCFHEYAHAYVADKLGDSTPRMLGRMTLNPLVHIDIIWTIIIPIITLITGGIFFGGAKPVPVNPRNFKDQTKGMAIVALAGPLSNIFLALIFTITIKVIITFFHNIISLKTMVVIFNMLQAGIIINLFLAFFNLVPIPPLDGSRVLKIFLSPSAGHKLDMLAPYSFILIILFWQFGILNFLVGYPARTLYDFAIGLIR